MPLNTSIYKPEVFFDRKSVFGESAGRVNPSELPDSPIIKAFLDDDDIQEITICSTCIGFVYRIQKIYRKDEDES